MLLTIAGAILLALALLAVAPLVGLVVVVLGFIVGFFYLVQQAIAEPGSSLAMLAFFGVIGTLAFGIPLWRIVRQKPTWTPAGNTKED